jgi:hypothetical protein
VQAGGYGVKDMIPKETRDLICDIAVEIWKAYRKDKRRQVLYPKKPDRLTVDFVVGAIEILNKGERNGRSA